jgi:phosphatidylinositol glycan class H protein
LLPPLVSRWKARHPSTCHDHLYGRPLSLLPCTQCYDDTEMVLPLLARLTAPPTQTLHTLAPTPSTVSFTVSTRPVPTTLAAKLGHFIGLLTRVVVGVCTLALLWVKRSLSHASPHTTDALLWALGGPQTASLLKAVGGMGWMYMGPAALLVLFLVLRRGYTGSLHAVV